jgi:uncharacterized membrane protein
MSPNPEMRIGDSEREAAVSALGEHYASGRLTKEEYDERSSKAYAARTSSDLWPLFNDLPGPQAPASDRRRPRFTPTVQSGRGHPGWWFGAWMAPVLLVVIVLAIVQHLPLLLLLVFGFFLWRRTSRHWSGNRHWSRDYTHHR